jgi:peptide/nickel transport system permease protein
MWTYLSRRTIQAAFTLLIITFISYLLTSQSADPMAQYANRPGMTGEQKERIRQSLGLDQPLHVRYFNWLSLAVRGDLGTSFFAKQDVLSLILQRLPMTLILMSTALTVTVILSLLLGITAAVRQYSWIDNLITSFSFVGYSMPIFFIALGMMLIFAVQFKEWGLPYLPTGAGVWDPGDPAQLIRHMILPVVCLVIISTAGYSRFLRSSILEVLGQDYVRTARAKGLVDRDVLFKHALRNAALPFITLLGLDLAAILGGAVVTESVYAWPGMGRLFWEYAQRGDFPVVNGVLLLTSTAVVVMTIVTDIAYTFVDPRIRLS